MYPEVDPILESPDAPRAFHAVLANQGMISPSEKRTDEELLEEVYPVIAERDPRIRVLIERAIEQAPIADVRLQASVARLELELEAARRLGHEQRVIARRKRARKVAGKVADVLGLRPLNPAA